ncbi:hypothetical protein V6N13_005453 [Hibiscus sabdariffa]
MSMKLSFLLLLLVAILKSEVQGLEHVVDDGRQIEGDSRVERRVDSLSHLDQSVMVFFTLKDLVVGNLL